MFKKILIIGIILLFLGISINPIQVSSSNIIKNNEKPGEIFFGLKSHIDITWDENESLKPIMPNNENRKISINISYWITWGIFGRLINLYLRENGVFIHIEITDKPEYCEASFRQNEMYIPFPKKQNIRESYYNPIFIVLDEHAPAYEEFNITIQATMDYEIKGPLGFITLISPTNITVNLTLIPDYWGIVSYMLPEGSIIETPPLMEKQLPIIVQNLANGKTLIESEIILTPPDFIVYLAPENLILGVGENKTMYLNVIAPSNFSGVETILTKFTPHYYYNHSIVGSIEIISFAVFYFPP